MLSVHKKGENTVLHFSLYILYHIDTETVSVHIELRMNK